MICKRRNRPNLAAAGNGAAALLLHIGRFGRAVPEPRCSAMKVKPMTGHASRYAIVVVEANFTLDDPDEVVGSNLWFVSALFEEYLAADAIPAIRDFRPPH